MKLPRLDQVPRTPEEMVALLLEFARARAYVDVSTEARRRRLTENDIAIIERRVLDLIEHDPAIAAEFTTFETEPVFAKAKALVKEYFTHSKVARVQNILEK